MARLGRHVEIALGKAGLTMAQYRALSQLDEGPEASSSLAAKLAVSRPSVTTVVDGLVERGLVDRGSTAADRRSVSVALTDSGRRVLAQADEAVQSRLADILAEAADDEAEALAVAGLERWRAAMDARRRMASKAGEQAASGQHGVRR